MPHGGKRQGAGRPVGGGRFKEKTKPLRVPESKVFEILKFIEEEKIFKRPLYTCHVSAGFPSPADDHIEESLDLNKFLIERPAATFFLRVSGDSMIDAGIHHGDILVVDRSLEANHKKIVIAAVDGQLTVKRLIKKNKETWLYPENKKYSPLLLSEEQDLIIWGVVSSVIHRV